MVAAAEDGGAALAVLDLTAETNAPTAFRERAFYVNLPLLDLVPLKTEQIATAVECIRRQRAEGRRVFVHCQLGLQRSALIMAHWLVASDEAVDLDMAVKRIRALEPDVVI